MNIDEVSVRHEKVSTQHEKASTKFQSIPVQNKSQARRWSFSREELSSAVWCTRDSKFSDSHRTYNIQANPPIVIVHTHNIHVIRILKAITHEAIQCSRKNFLISSVM